MTASVLDMGDEDWRLREQSMMVSSARFVGGCVGEGPLVPLRGLSPQVFIDLPKNSQKYNIAEPLWFYHKSSTDGEVCVVSLKDRNLGNEVRFCTEWRWLGVGL